MASPFSSDWLLCFIPALFNLGLKDSSINWQNFCFILLAVMSFGAILRWLCPGGWAWGNLARRNTIPGPRGWPVMGNLLDMGYNAHRKLKDLAVKYNAMQLMSMSLGNTRLIVAFKPEIARELLNHSAFADRPLKQSAQQLLFGRAIGFAPYGDYWRNLRRIASNNLFSPHRIAASAKLRQAETTQMIQEMNAKISESEASLCIRPFLQRASLNNLLGSVFGKRFNFSVQSEEAEALQAMVREGFELLGAFNWADHLPFLRSVDPHDIHSRCSILVPKVKSFVQNIIDEHRKSPKSDSEESDFVDVLLSLEDKLQDDDMVAVLWEMIFRGTDTTAILAEWILAEISLHPEIQAKLHEELDAEVGKERMVEESDIPKLKFMQAVVKETLRMHPPGPLLSWARLSNVDTKIGGHFVPAGTTAMVNMWSICHDEEIWAHPNTFNPNRFIPELGGNDIDIKGSDLRLAPFGAGRRVCPGRMLGLATVHLWIARLLHHFEFSVPADQPLHLSEILKLSCEMVNPLHVKPVPRLPIITN